MTATGVVCAWCGRFFFDREQVVRHGPTCEKSPGYALRMAVLALQIHPCTRDACDHPRYLKSDCRLALIAAIAALPVEPQSTEPPLAVAE